MSCVVYVEGAVGLPCLLAFKGVLMSRSRSSSAGIAQSQIGPAPVEPRSDQGVGGRQGDGRACPAGGGYLETCTDLKFSESAGRRDPRLDQLGALGLQPAWLRLAEQLGVDLFLTVWRTLDADDTPVNESGTLTLTLRRYACWQRAERDGHIRALKAAGLPTRQVRERLLDNYGQRLSPAHVRRIR